MEKVQGARIPDLDRKKYLVPGDLTGERSVCLGDKISGPICLEKSVVVRALYETAGTMMVL